MTSTILQKDLAGLLGQYRREMHAGAGQADLDKIDLQIGWRIRQEFDADNSLNLGMIARWLGTNTATVEQAAWGYGYKSHWEATALGMYVVVLDGGVAAHYVKTQEARIVRSISAFDESDAALRSNLHPSVFADEDNLDAPAMLWHLDTDEWVGVSMTSVGYGGEGPRLACAALIAAGVDRDHAEEISEYRFCDAVEVSDPTTWETSTIWPVEGRTWPTLVARSVVVPWGERVPGSGFYRVPSIQHRDPDPTGFYPSSQSTPGWEQWIDFLDQETVPDWAEGTRTARLFFSEEQSKGDGYELEGRGMGRGHFSSPAVVIQQGSVNLWAFPDRPGGSGRLVHDDSIRYLKRAGFDTTNLERGERRRSSWWARSLRLFFGPKVPEPGYFELLPPHRFSRAST